MSNLNKVQIIGRVGKDPELRYTTNGSAIVNITVATSRKWKDKGTGQASEETEWHRVSAFERLAEIIGEYVRKGSLIYVEGRLKTRKWTDKDGRDVYATEIIADQMQMLGGRNEDGAAATAQPVAQRPAPPARPSAPPQKSNGGGFEYVDDCIPF
jgi:single-strand DNA-binding protein